MPINYLMQGAESETLVHIEPLLDRRRWGTKFWRIFPWPREGVGNGAGWRMGNELPEESGTGIWASIFGWKALFRWDVLGAIVPGIFVAVGFAMLTLDWFPGNLLLGQVCFAVAGLLCVIKTVGHAIEHKGGVFGRVIFAVMLSAIFIGIDSYFVWAVQKHKTPNLPNPARVSIEWNSPSPINVGTPLSDAQLNAKALVDGKRIEGVFTYDPTFGTTLGPGTQTLSASFNPSDTSRYLPNMMTISLTVLPKLRSTVWHSTSSGSHATQPAPEEPVIIQQAPTYGNIKERIAQLIWELNAFQKIEADVVQHLQNPKLSQEERDRGLLGEQTRFSNRYFQFYYSRVVAIRDECAAKSIRSNGLDDELTDENEYKSVNGGSITGVIAGLEELFRAIPGSPDLPQ